MVSDIPAGDGNIGKLFYGVQYTVVYTVHVKSVLVFVGPSQKNP